MIQILNGPNRIDVVMNPIPLSFGPLSAQVVQAVYGDGYAPPGLKTCNAACSVSGSRSYLAVGRVQDPVTGWSDPVAVEQIGNFSYVGNPVGAGKWIVWYGAQQFELWLEDPLTGAQSNHLRMTT